MKLSIILPVYNEEKTLEEIVKRVQDVKIPKVSKELVIVNDYSKDKSQQVIDALKKKYKNIIAVQHERNKGKGAAIRTGLQNVSGDIVVIQDGDLEYNPQDFKKLIIPILEGKTNVVYGSRLMGRVGGFSISSHYYGNLLLSFITRFLFNQKITDMETCYKMMRTGVFKSLNLVSNRFDIEPEITSKLLKRGHRVIEIPINYTCRSFEEGKKITWRDGFVAIYTLFKFRFF